jgi:hypothetical protein
MVSSCGNPMQKPYHDTMTQVVLIRMLFLEFYLINSTCKWCHHMEILCKNLTMTQ